MQTKTKNGRKNGDSKTTPLKDILGGAKRSPGRPPKPAMNALQLADCFEAEAKRLQGVADILRGKA